ncbi:Glutathione-regulated potassium-efflux system protein KefB [uncultured archaeon]|nr:Glutathione-regulated potassium-efflux system protein KefB [uncultured archaeon]
MFNLIQSFIASMPSNLGILSEIALIIIIATILALVIRIFKQPLIPAYILTGIIIGPLVLGLIKNQDLVMALSEIGVAFLIFTAGLEIKFKKLKEVGKTILVGGILQIALLFFIAFFVSKYLNFNNPACVYIGLVVAFSSTMIVVKLLSDKREINSLHGRIIIGILLIQDIVAIIALAVLASDFSIKSIAIICLKGVAFIVATAIISKLANPVFRAAAKAHDLLLLVSISFLFLFVIGALVSGLSLIIGAFFAGVALANSDFKTEIQGKITPLREFFAVIFFVALGMQLKLISGQFILLFFILLALVLIVKPIVTMFVIRLLGYKKTTSFLTGNALAQTSEFSFIIVTLGFSLGYINDGLFSTLVLLTIFTMSISTYLIGYEKKTSKILSWPLNVLNKFHSKNENLEYHGEDGKKVLIFGCHRMGSLFLKEFEKNKNDIFVIDYNPEIIKPLMSKKVPCIYGDYVNEEVLNKIDLNKAEIIISTIPDFEENILLIKKVKKMNPKITCFVVAERISEARELYRAGADYVILPQVIGGQKVSEIIGKIKTNKSEMHRIKKEHLDYLDSIHNILY